MIEVNVPGFGEIRLAHLVLDFNGTIAVDGVLISGVRERLTELASHLKVHVITADTFGVAKAQLEGIPCELTVFPKESQDTGKLEFIRRLGCESVVSMGNGRNDRWMLAESRIGIGLILEEGASMSSLSQADVIFTNVLSALDFLKNPLRIIATLRS